MPGSVSGWCSVLPRLDCSARARSTMSGLGDWALDASWDLGGHARQWCHCSSGLHLTDYVDGRNLAAWDTRQFDGGQTLQRNAHDACDVRLPVHVLKLGRSGAIASGRSAAAWMETLHCLIRRSHHHLTRKSGHLAGGTVFGALP